ncbi:hypothetical protein GCK32_009977 [Trichostrongylus colubriformis]|uniref:Cadherin domain-containing protein n=1 Tax=Trichostrongylus colubriformis TaxID=6319 RepID=A0AAN8F6I0_TRICO
MLRFPSHVSEISLDTLYPSTECYPLLSHQCVFNKTVNKKGLSSYLGGLNVDDVAFDAKNASMLRAVVAFDTDRPSTAQLSTVQNNTVTVLQGNMMGTSIPVATSESLEHGVRYSLDHVHFTPTQNGTGVPNNSTSTLFFVDPVNGEINANPQLSEQPQGVYTVVVIDTKTTEPLHRIVKKFHYVKDDLKLRYVFSTKLKEFAASRGQFSKKLQEALKVDHPEGHMQVFLSEPKRDMRNASRTSVCFHVLKNEQVQSERSAISALSQTAVENSELSRLYHNYKVINIERCEATSMPMVRQSSFQLPTHVLLLVAGVAILIVVLVALLTYICFVRRYREHLRMKQKQMKMSERASSQLRYSPTFILPPGGPRYY